MIIEHAVPNKLNFPQDSITSEKAERLVKKNELGVHDFVCGLPNIDGNGTCQVEITLCAVSSTHRHSYFRQHIMDQLHTCNICNRSNSNASSYSRHISAKYANGEAILDFSGSKEDNSRIERREKTNDDSLSGNKFKSSKDSKSNENHKKIVKRKAHLNTLAKVVENKDTEQRLPDGHLVKVKGLFRHFFGPSLDNEFKKNKLQPIYFSKVLIYKNNDYSYRLFIVDPAETSEPITLYLTSGQLGQLISEFEDYISEKGKKTKYLKLYTTLKPFLKGKYYDIKLPENYRDIKHYLLIQK